MRTWFITGVSSGFGHAIAEAALAAGDRVIGTLRSDRQAQDFSARVPGRSFGVLLDLKDAERIQPTLEAVEREIAPVDILVNNAGYGHEGTFEESSMEDLRHQFEVNVFAAVAVTKAMLPGMRQRRSGHVINITSVGGIITMPGLSFYHGSKFALEGLSEALGREVRPFGVHVTAVEPGAFRTNWSGSSMSRAGRHIADYDAQIDPIHEKRARSRGSQIGDPDRLAQAVLALVASESPPAHLLLGSDAVAWVAARAEQVRAEFDAWKDVTISTDFYLAPPSGGAGG